MGSAPGIERFVPLPVLRRHEATLLDFVDALPQNRVDPGQQLRPAGRLHNVVLGAGEQAAESLALLRSRCPGDVGALQFVNDHRRRPTKVADRLCDALSWILPSG